METVEKRLALIHAMTMAAYAEIEAMKAANALRLSQGYEVQYNEHDFRRVPEDFGVAHNQVIEYLNI